jgi:hypothetical protein
MNTNPKPKYSDLSMLLRKLVPIVTIVGIANLPLSASATKVLIRTACLHPTQGEGVCEVEFPKSANTNIWDITWQDRTKTRIRFSDGNSIIQRWNSQNNQWVDSSNIGLCMDRRCLYFPPTRLKYLEQATSRFAIECLDPTLGQSKCQAEYVPGTKGLRVYWSGGSIEHYKWTNDNTSFLKWSHDRNGWVKVSNWGLCADKFCLLFDPDAFK